MAVTVDAPALAVMIMIITLVAILHNALKNRILSVFFFQRMCIHMYCTDTFAYVYI